MGVYGPEGRAVEITMVGRFKEKRHQEWMGDGGKVGRPQVWQRLDPGPPSPVVPSGKRLGGRDRVAGCLKATQVL